jgi:Zn-finger protein
MTISKAEASYKHFSNRACRFFPCHQTDDPKIFNCLFCYCPLYTLGRDCGGEFTYNAKGIKDCSGCLLPHLPEGYDYVTCSFSRIVASMRDK